MLKPVTKSANFSLFWQKVISKIYCTNEIFRQTRCKKKHRFNTVEFITVKPVLIQQIGSFLFLTVTRTVLLVGACCIKFLAFSFASQRCENGLFSGPLRL